MDKQQFDHIENRIRQAAEEFSVGFNEGAWLKMETKLDNEFNKTRRRGGIWWWFSLLLLIIAGSGIYFFATRSSTQPAKNSVSNSLPRIGTPYSGKKPGYTAVKPENKNIREISPGQKKQSLQDPHTDDNKNIRAEQQAVKPLDPQIDVPAAVKIKKSGPADENGITGKEAGIRMSKKIAKGNTRGSKTNRYAADTKRSVKNDIAVTSGEREPTNAVSSDPVNAAPDKNTEDKVIETPVVDSMKKPVATNAQPADTAVKKDSLDKKAVVDKKSNIKNAANTPSKGFYFIGSIAADATNINTISTKEIKPEYGLGIGYRFNKRWSVQTGFFAGKKIYTAGPDDYKVKPGSFIAKIISADAVCNIYDIPLTIRYDVVQRKKNFIYLTTGLSSLFLKRETYDMHFFNPSGTYRHMSYTYTNNKDFLSVANFSVGYERKLTNAFYAQAEPYLKLPLSGVGEGHVKLYSVGLQVGIKYQPLKRKK